MNPDLQPQPRDASARRIRLAYLVSHPIQYQAPLLRRIAQEPGIDLTVLFGSDFSLRGYRDEGFGVEVTWDTPLVDGYKHEFLRPWRDIRDVSSTSPISRGLHRRLRGSGSGTNPAFDALWVHGYASINSLQAILSAYSLGIPVLMRAESWLADRPRSRRALFAKACLLRILRHGIAATLPIGSHNAAYWRHYFGDHIPQFPMPYAVDNTFFAQESAAEQAHAGRLRAELHIPPGAPVILFASKLQPRKHADHLVEAYRRLLASQASSATLLPHLVIAGDGEQRASLESACRDAGLTSVHFVGFHNQTELPALFALADVFVLPSQHEPWGLIVNEAMSAGCPVILSSDVGAAPDLVTNGVEGFVYPVGDIAALVEALRRLLADRAATRRMGEAARERMLHWSFEEDVLGLRAALAFTTRKLHAPSLAGPPDRPSALLS